MINRKPTLKDVGKLAGVSVATVSRILNDLPGFNEVTKQRVLDAIDELGYKRNELARNLKMQSSKFVAVLLPKTLTFYYMTVMKGIEQYAMQEGYTVMMCNVGNFDESVQKYMTMISERQVNGVIACSDSSSYAIDKRLHDLKIPCVLVNSMSEIDNCRYILVDEEHSTYTAIEYFIKKGHKRIALLSGTRKDSYARKLRIEGYKKALSAHNIPYDDSLVEISDNFSFNAGVESFERLLARTSDFTAILTGSDEAAAAVISSTSKKGISVPGDLSIIGFNNSPLSSMLTPALTTVAQPLFEIGQDAMKMLIGQMEHNVYSGNRIIRTGIMERDSVADIRTCIHNDKRRIG